jgi:hypothetical protein
MSRPKFELLISYIPRAPSLAIRTRMSTVTTIVPKSLLRGSRRTWGIPRSCHPLFEYAIWIVKLKNKVGKDHSWTLLFGGLFCTEILLISYSTYIVKNSKREILIFYWWNCQITSNKTFHLLWPWTLFPLKVVVPCEKCSWFKIVIMKFLEGLAVANPPQTQIPFFLS